MTTQAAAFSSPTVTLTQGQVLKIESTATHPVGPFPGGDATLTVPEGQTKCFRFTGTGTFMIRCTVHGYAGTITVN